MALPVTSDKKNAAVPLLSRLMRTDGNIGKVDAAQILLRTVARTAATEVVAKKGTGSRRTGARLGLRTVCSHVLVRD
jgi:hypothetical protein